VGNFTLELSGKHAEFMQYLCLQVCPVLNLRLANSQVELETWSHLATLGRVLIFVRQRWKLRSILDNSKNLFLSSHNFLDLLSAELVVFDVWLDRTVGRNLLLELWCSQISSAFSNTFYFAHLDGVNKFEVV